MTTPERPERKRLRTLMDIISYSMIDLDQTTRQTALWRTQYVLGEAFAMGVGWRNDSHDWLALEPQLEFCDLCDALVT